MPAGPPLGPIGEEPMQQMLPGAEQVEEIIMDAEPIVEIIEPGIIGADIPVIAAPARGRVPWVALAAGAAALGGVLFYFTRRK